MPKLKFIEKEKIVADKYVDRAKMTIGKNDAIRIAKNFSETDIKEVLYGLFYHFVTSEEYISHRGKGNFVLDSLIEEQKQKLEKYN